MSFKQLAFATLAAILAGAGVGTPVAAETLTVGAYPASFGGFLQISGFRFTYDASKPNGSRVVSVTLNDGTAVPNSPSVTLTATTNNFTNAGGDGYTMFADGQGVTRDLMATVVADYITKVGTITPALDGRITRIG